MDSANSRIRKALKEMCLMDDALFSKCFDGDRKCSSLMLRIILGRNDLDVTEARTQRWIQNIENHSVKLDIAAKDSKGKLYNRDAEGIWQVPEEEGKILQRNDRDQVTEEGTRL